MSLLKLCKNYLMLNRVRQIFSHIQSCLIEIMKIKGSNNYQIPHMKKDMILNRGTLLTQLKFDREVVEDTLRYLSNGD
jgi:hypothetical protein